MFEAYKIAVKLSLVNGVSSGITALAGQFTSLNQHINSTHAGLSQLERQLLSIKRLGLVGGAMAAAGGFGLSLFGAPLAAAKEYETAYARFKTLNLGEAVNKQADSFARGTKAFGTSSTQLMETLRESVGMFGDMKIAQGLAPVIAQLNVANSALFGGKVGKIDDAGVRSIMRFNDMRGLTNTPEDFKRGLDLAQRLVTGSGGSIKFGDLETLAKRGGAAFKGLSDDGVMMLATVMQEQGGNATGTALMSLYQNLIAGRTTKKTMAALQAAGLVTLTEVNSGSVGGQVMKSTQVAKVVDEQLLRENPGAWLMKYGTAAAQKAGAKTDSEVIGFMNSLVSNRTGSNLAATFTTQQLQALRDFNLVRNAQGAQQTIDTFRGTTQGGLVEMQAKFNSLMIELGNTVLPIAIKAVEGLTSVIKGALEFAREFPVVTKAMAIGFGVLSGLVAAGGVIMLASAAFQGLGLALGAISGIGGIFALGAASPIILGVAALGVALWGVSKLLPGIQSKNDGKEHAGEHWVPGHGRSGAGGYWAKDSEAAPTNYVRPSAPGRQHMINNTIVMPNGRVLANVVTEQISNDARRPSASGTRFDGSMSPVSPGMTGAH